MKWQKVYKNSSVYNKKFFEYFNYLTYDLYVLVSIHDTPVFLCILILFPTKGISGNSVIFSTLKVCIALYIIFHRLRYRVSMSPSSLILVMVISKH